MDQQIAILSSLILADFGGLEPRPVIAPKERELPEGFEAIFGPIPKGADFRGTRNPSFFYRIALVKWEQDLRYFKRAGVPPFADAEQVELATKTFKFWNMGAPHFYEGRYGWVARFPDSQESDFEAAAMSALFTTHLNISQYQIRLLLHGIVPAKIHPFVPPFLTLPATVKKAAARKADKSKRKPKRKPKRGAPRSAARKAKKA